MCSVSLLLHDGRSVWGVTSRVQNEYRIVSATIQSNMTYRPLPDWILFKKCCINVDNSRRLKDKSFCLAVLSSLRDADYTCRATSYEPFMSTLNLGDLEFPLKVEDVPKFSALNPALPPFRVFEAGDEERTFRVVLTSERLDAINILLYKGHYCWIKKLDAFLSRREKGGRHKFCPRCLGRFSTPGHLLNHHERWCESQTTQTW